MSIMYLMMQKNTLSILSILLLTVADYSSGYITRSGFDLKNCDAIVSEELDCEIKKYEVILNQIIDEAVNGSFRGTTWRELRNFVDDIGPRFTGTKTLEDSIDYVLAKSEELCLENVQSEPVPVPTWIRGEESATLLCPRKKDIKIFGAAYSVGTPPDGITARAIVVKSFDELRARCNEVPGKIVVYNQEWVSLDETIKYRIEGAIEAAKLGAVAVLIRSLTPVSIYSVHTGYVDYAENVTKIPAACIAVEDATLLDRFASRGLKIKLNIKMGAQQLEDTTSRNVITEIAGSESPEKIVVLSGHIDSLDVSQGAMDDAGGAFIAWQSLALLKKLGLSTKRTIRVIMWTGTEMKNLGASHYFAQHQNEMENYQFFMDSDTGTFLPLGWAITGSDLVICVVDKILQLLHSLPPLGVREPAIGPNTVNWINAGVPGASLWNENDRYFWYSHTEADTMDLQDPDTLDMATALFAATAYILADISVDLPHQTPPE